jgi:hypothetical protein
MAVKIGNRCRTESNRVSGELVRIGRVMSTIRTDDGEMVRVQTRHLRRTINHPGPAPKHDYTTTDYPAHIVALAKANGVSCKQCSEWLRESA